MRGTTQLDRELPVKLTPDEIEARAESIAAKLIHIGSLRKKRREDLRSINALIESEMDEVERLARVISDGVESRKQADIRFGDEVVPSSTEAGAALAEVMKVAGDATPQRFHRDGGLCRKTNCRKKVHHTAEALRANGIQVEGDELMPEVPTQVLCGAAATVMIQNGDGDDSITYSCDEHVRSLQAENFVSMQAYDGAEPQACRGWKPAVVPELPAEEEDVEAIEDEQIEVDGFEASGDGDQAVEGEADEDVRAKCAGCGTVLSPTEIVKKLGRCETCQVQPHQEINVKDEASNEGAAAVSA